MTVYPINENELRSMGLVSAAVAFCASMISGTLAFAITVLWDIANSTDAAKIRLGSVVLVVCAVAIVLFGVIGVLAHKQKRDLLARILSEVVVQ